MNLGELVNYTYRHLVYASETKLEPWAGEPAVVEYLNVAQSFLVETRVLNDSGYFMDVRTLAELGIVPVREGPLWSFEIPESLLSVRRIETVSGQGAVAEAAYVPLKNWSEGLLFSGLSISAGPGQWFFLGRRKIGQTHQVDPAATRLYFVRRPADLVRLRASAGSTDQIARVVTGAGEGGWGKAPAQEGYYFDAEFEVVQTADPAVEPLGEKRRVLSYTKGAFPNYDLGFDRPFSAALADGMILDSVPTIEAEHHEVLCAEAAMRMLIREGDQQHLRAIDHLEARIFPTFVRSSKERQSQSPIVPHFTRLP